MTKQHKAFDYKIFRYSNSSFLEQTVCEELQDGWQP